MSMPLLPSRMHTLKQWPMLFGEGETCLGIPWHTLRSGVMCPFFCRKITPDIYGLPHGVVNAEIVNDKVVSINK